MDGRLVAQGPPAATGDAVQSTRRDTRPVLAAGAVRGTVCMRLHGDGRETTMAVVLTVFAAAAGPSRSEAGASVSRLGRVAMAGAQSCETASAHPADGALRPASEPSTPVDPVASNIRTAGPRLACSIRCTLFARPATADPSVGSAVRRPRPTGPASPDPTGWQGIDMHLNNGLLVGESENETVKKSSNGGRGDRNKHPFGNYVPMASSHALPEMCSTTHVLEWRPAGCGEPTGQQNPLHCSRTISRSAHPLKPRPAARQPEAPNA
jgi:hypothetical protein